MSIVQNILGKGGDLHVGAIPLLLHVGRHQIIDVVGDDTQIGRASSVVAPRRSRVFATTLLNIGTPRCLHRAAVNVRKAQRQPR